MQAIEISLTALNVEWRRLEVIAENLANANTVLTPFGKPYQPKHLISGPRSDFAAHLDADAQSATDARNLGGVMVYGIEAVANAPRLVHEPGNPQADENGFVAYPGIDHAAEMPLMLKTARIYEANLVAISTARQMYSKALELGNRQ